jgi:hypothetical protein
MARPILEVGEWLKRNPGWLEGSTRSPFSWFTSGVISSQGQRVFCHLFRVSSDTFTLAEIANKVLEVSLLDGGRKLDFEQKPDGRLVIKGLPQPQDPVATVLEIKVEGEPAPLKDQSSFWIPN